MFFKNFDYLASVYGFSFEDSMRYQTNCGGFLSIVLSIIALVTIGQMGSSFFNRTTPTISQDSDKFYSPPTVSFDSKFNVAFRMTVGSQNLYKELDMIKIKFFQVTVYKSNFSNVTQVEVPLSVCSSDKFPYQIQYFDEFNLSESLCPTMDGRIMTGAFLSEYYIYYSARFYLCENDPLTGKSIEGDGVKCKNLDQVEEFLKLNNVRAHIFYSDADYDTSDYSSPNISYMNNYNVDLSFNTLRETHLYYQYYNMTSDDTYFFLAPSARTFSNLAFNYFAERPSYRESFNKNFAIFNVRTDKTIYSVRRSYTLFSQTIANIGAILNICLLFFKVIIFTISRMQFFTRLLKHSVYLTYKSPHITLKLDSDKEKDKAKLFSLGKNLEDSKINMINPVGNTEANLMEGKQNQKPEILSLSKSQLPKTTILKENNNLIVTKLNEELTKKFESFNLVKYKNNYNFIELCIYSICPCVRICHTRTDRDLTLIDYSRKYYYRYTDFFKFLDKFIEMNIFKKLFLKKEEQEIVDALRRVILVKNLEVHDIVTPKMKAAKSDIANVANLANSRLGKKGSLPALEEKIKKFVLSSIEKTNRTVFESNIVEHFDDILKG